MARTLFCAVIIAYLVFPLAVQSRIYDPPPPKQAGDAHCPVAQVKSTQLAVIVNTGIEAKKEGQYDIALSCFMDALRLDPDFAITYNNLAALYLSTHQLDLAAEALERAIRLKPDMVESYMNYGNVQYEQAKYDKAKKAYKKVVELSPSAYSYNQLAIAQFMLNDMQGSIDSCRKALEFDPAHSHALYNLGNSYRRLGQLDKALEVAERGVKLGNKDVLHYNALGTVLHELGRLEDAVKAYKKGLKISPTYADAHSNLGNILSDLRRYDEALKHHLKASKLGPTDPRYLNNLGLIYRRLNRVADSVKAYERATAAAPHMPDPWFNYGNMLKEDKRFDEALRAFKRASAIQPDNSNYINGQGSVYFDLGKFDEAKRAYEKAIALSRDSPDLRYNYANTLKEMNDYNGAIEQYTEALRLINEPAGSRGHDWTKKVNELRPKTFYDLFYAKSFVANWDNRDADLQTLQGTMQAQLDDDRVPDVLPFQGISYPLSGEVLLQLTRRHAQKEGRFIKEHFKQTGTSLQQARRVDADKRLRIGYVSADFRDHPVAEDMVQLYQFHNRDQFEIFCFAVTGDDGSLFRRQIKSYADHFIDISPLNDLAGAQEIEKHGIHILIDLTGYTRQHRIGIFAARPSPVQILYKGFAGTSGADYFDYVIGDRIVTPPVFYEKHFSEKALFMPHQFFVNNFRYNSQHVLDLSLRPSKQEHSIPTDKFLFCNFNKMFKIEPRVFALWVKILRRVPNSVIWLLAFPEQAVEHLGKALKRAGLGADRLFVTRLFKKEDHLLIKSHCDVFLDTLEYNAHGTAAEALWAGIPVLTQPGPRMTARVAASLVTAAEIPEMIVHSDDAYVERAVTLANDPEALNQIKSRLRERRMTAPLFDVARWLQNFEAGLQLLWEVYSVKAGPRGARSRPLAVVVSEREGTASDDSRPPPVPPPPPRHSEPVADAEPVHVDTPSSDSVKDSAPPPPPSTQDTDASSGDGDIKRIFVPMDPRLLKD